MRLETTLHFLLRNEHARSLMALQLERVYLHHSNSVEIWKHVEELKCYIYDLLTNMDDNCIGWNGITGMIFSEINKIIPTLLESINKKNSTQETMFDFLPSVTTMDDEEELIEDQSKSLERKDTGYLQFPIIYKIFHSKTVLSPTTCFSWTDLKSLVAFWKQTVRPCQSETEQDVMIIDTLRKMLNLHENSHTLTFPMLSIISGGELKSPSLVLHELMEECLVFYFNNEVQEGHIARLQLVSDFIDILRTAFQVGKHYDLCELKTFLFFSVEYFLPFILYLCFSFHPPLRDTVMSLLRIMEPFPLVVMDESILRNHCDWFIKIDKKKIIDDSWSVLIELTECENWINELKEDTFYTEFIPLKYKEAKSILKKHERYAFGLSTQDETEEILEHLSKRIDQTIQSKKFSGQAFIKLSSRSPKDAAFEINNYDEKVKEMAKVWHKTYHAELDPAHTSELLHKKYQSAISQICAAQCMKVTKGSEMVHILVISDRAFMDLDFILKYHDSEADTQKLRNDSDISMQLVIREWVDIPIWREVRTFVRNGKLTAMSQYFTHAFFPQVSLEEWKKVKQAIVSSFENHYSKIIPLNNCCIDFLVDLERDVVKVIELNTFGDICGPALFSWEVDRDIIYNGPLQFRVATNSQIEKDYHLI